MIWLYMVEVALAAVGATLPGHLGTFAVLVSLVALMTTLLVDGMKWWGRRQQMDSGIPKVYDYENEIDEDQECP